MTNTLNQIEKILKLQNDSYFQSAKMELANAGTNENQKKLSMAILLSTIADAYIMSNDAQSLKEYIDKDTEDSFVNMLVDRMHKVNSENCISDVEFAKILEEIQSVLCEARAKKMCFTILPSLQELTEELSISKRTAGLDKLDKNKSASNNKDVINSCLNETLIVIKTKAQTNAKENFKAKVAPNKKLSENAKKRVDHIDDLTSKISVLLKSTDNVNYDQLEYDILRLIKIEKSFYQMLSLKKENSPLGNARTTTRTTQTPTVTRPTSLAKTPAGTTQTPTATRPTSSAGTTAGTTSTNSQQINKPVNPRVRKTLLIGGAVVAVVGLTVGSYFLIKNMDKDNKNPNSNSDYEIDIEKELAENTKIIYANWQEHGIDISEEMIAEIIKALNGYDSVYTIDEADEIILEVLNAAIKPGLNNILAGEKNTTSEIDFASLIIGKKDGLRAVEIMEDNLNGCITEPDDIAHYATEAFIDEAVIIGEEGTVKGLNIASDTKTDPGVRIIWARLAQGVNAFAGTLGTDFSVEVDDKIYYQTELNDGVAITSIIDEAKKDLGSQSKRMIIEFDK